VLPWSGRAISTRLTRSVAAPMASCEPSCAPMAASSRESGQTSPGGGMPATAVPGAKGAAATSSRPRSG
jgi:hypothetical protein